jgi:hypothetical protein
MKIEDLLNSDGSKEALRWLQNGRPDSRMLGELPTTVASIALVQELYALGATRVTASNIQTYDTGEENTGRLIVSLPKEPNARERVFEWCAEWAEQLGFEPERDVGQEHIFVMLD